MATRQTQKPTFAKKLKEAHAQQREKLLLDHEKMFKEGDIYSKFAFWIPGGERNYATVKSALQKAKLPDNTCNPIAARAAFNRARHKLEKDRAIDAVNQDGDVVRFQLTKKVLSEMVDEDTGETETFWDYVREAKLLLNIDTGKVTCKNKEIEKFAQKLVDDNTEIKTVSDITGIVKGLFKRKLNENMTSLKDGIYLVKKEHFDFLDQVDEFMKDIGWRLIPLPVRYGENKEVDNQITLSVKEENEQKIKALAEAIRGLNVFSRKKELEEAVDKVKALRLQVQGQIAYLKEAAFDLDDELELLDKEALEKVTATQKEKAELKKENGEEDDDTPKFDCLGRRIKSESGRINEAIIGNGPKSIEEVVKETGLPIARVKGHCNWMVEHSAAPDWKFDHIMIKTKDGKFQVKKVKKEKKDDQEKVQS